MGACLSRKNGCPQQKERNHQPAALGSAVSTPEEEPPFEFSTVILESLKCCLEVNDFWNVKNLLRRATPIQRQQVFNEPGLRKCLHQAALFRNLEMLKYLVSECQVPLEERNDEGLTVLYCCVWYNWTDGALFLLQSGADIHNADRGLSDLGSVHEPLVHVVVRSCNETLLAELLKRGADIHVKSSSGYNCLILCKPLHWFTKIVWQKMNEAKLEKGERPCGPGGRELSDFEEMLYSHDGILDAEKFIWSRDPTARKRLLQLLGVWYATRANSGKASFYWKEARKLSSKDKFFHPETESSLDNSFARIIGEEQLRNILHSDLEGLGFRELRIRSLLVAEKLSPDSLEMTRAAVAVAGDFLHSKDVDKPIALMSQLTKVKVLQPSECWEVLDLLNRVINLMPLLADPNPDSVLTLMATTTNCLRIMTSSSTFGFNRSPLTRKPVFASHGSGWHSRHAVDSAQKIFAEAMRFFLHIDQRATEKRLLRFHDHVKDFLNVFPWIHGNNILLYFTPSGWTLFNDARVIKTLVVCSAELRGTLWHQNSPLHLQADHNGDTPLHLMAQYLSKKDLLEREVLDCFLDHGAHLCTRNNEGKSARDILLRRRCLTPGECLPSLQCLAATGFMRDPELRDKVDQCPVDVLKFFLLSH